MLGIEENQREQPSKKRVLKKLRVQFLNRMPSEGYVESVEYTHHFVSDKNVHILNNILGLVEVDRKIQISVEHINPYIIYCTSLIKEDSKPGYVIFNLSFEKMRNMPSLEYLVKRLESYGDLELAAWAHRIKKYFEIRPEVIAKYLEMVKSEDIQVQRKLQKMRNIAKLACQEIERRYPFRKTVAFSNKQSTELLSIMFSEKMVEILGHTLEGFEAWSKENGQPSFLDVDSNIQFDLAKYLLGCGLNTKLSTVYERPEFLTFVTDKDGNKRLVVAQYVFVFDPWPEGFFSHGYFIIKGELQKNMICQQNQVDCKEEISGLKSYKESEISEETETSENSPSEEK